MNHALLKFSWTTRKSIMICFVRSWNIGFLAMFTANLLSYYKYAASSCLIPKSVNKYSRHCNSHVVDANALYSVSDELLEMLLYFLFPGY